MYDFTPILSRMKAAKKEAGLTSDELSARSGVPIGTLRKILAGATTEPKLPAMIAIATALGVSVDWLLYGTPVPAAGPSPEIQALEAALAQLNEEGREKLLDYAADLVASGRYIKTDTTGMVYQSEA